MAQPATAEAGNIYRKAGIPTTNTATLPMAKISPAKPPPTRIFAMLISARGIWSSMVHLPALSYHLLLDDLAVGFAYFAPSTVQNSARASII
jgi:hypothetical protein